MKRLFGLFVVLLSVWSYSQTVTITGTVRDPSGTPYANGSGRAVLVPQNQNWLFGTNPVPTPVVISGLDSFGHFSISLTNTSLISPSSANPLWQFSFCSQAVTMNPICFTMTPMSLTSSQDISAQIQSQAAVLPGTGGITLPVFGTGSTSVVGTTLGSNPPVGTCVVWQANGQLGFTSSCSAPAGIGFVTTAFNWSVTPTMGLTAGTTNTLTLTPCPQGIDATSGFGYQVYLSGGGNAEAVNVTGGTCTSGAGSGTIIFVPNFGYSANLYTVGSASSGIQETLNVQCGTSATYYWNRDCHVTLPANGYLTTPTTAAFNSYLVPGIIYLHANHALLNGSGATLSCTGRGPCLWIGDKVNSNHFTNNKVQNLAFQTNVNYSSNVSYAGVQISQTQRTAQVVTITTSVAHGFRVGDWVQIQFTDDARYWTTCQVSTVPTSSTFTFADAGPDIALQTTPGVVALAYEAVLDNAMNTSLDNISYSEINENGKFNNFFDFWDDENATITHFNNNAIALNGNANWNGSFLLSMGNPGGAPAGMGAQWAPVITLRDSTITANFSSGVTVYNSNGVFIENTVIQAPGLWQVYSSNQNGNFQGAQVKNVYGEASTANNPVSPVRTPYPGVGITGLFAGLGTGVSNFSWRGFQSPIGGVPSGGSGTTNITYYVVAIDQTSGNASTPLPILTWLTTGGDAPVIRWPRVASGADTIVYDIISAPVQFGAYGTNPQPGPGTPCPGGAIGTACGSIVVGLTQASACGTSLVCTFTDTASTARAAYNVAGPRSNFPLPITYWPGAAVTVNRTIVADYDFAVTGVDLWNTPSLIADFCLNFGQVTTSSYVKCLSPTSTANNALNGLAADLMMEGNWTGGVIGNSITKGRLNFITSPFATLQPRHEITIVDSQPWITTGTYGYRPPATGADTWIGIDVPSAGANLQSGQLAFGSPISISNYINNVGDNSSWLERLTSGAKTFNVPVVFQKNVSAAQVGGSTPTIDWSGAVHTTPTIKGTTASKPVTCTQGEQFFATDATAGQNLYFCTATNVWSQMTGGGGGGISGLTANFIPKATSPTAIANSLCSDNGTTFACTDTGGISAPFFTATNTGIPDTFPEQTAPVSPSAGNIYVWGDSTNHRLNDKNSSGIVGTTVVPSNAPAHNFANGLSTAGIIQYVQPAVGDVTGAAPSDSAVFTTFISSPVVIYTARGTVGGLGASYWNTDQNYGFAMGLSTNVTWSITQVQVTASTVIFSLSTPINAISWSVGDCFQATGLPATNNLSTFNNVDLAVSAKSGAVGTSTVTVTIAGSANTCQTGTIPGTLPAVGTYTPTGTPTASIYNWHFNGDTVVFNRLISSSNNCANFGSIRLCSGGLSTSDKLTLYDPNTSTPFVGLQRWTGSGPTRWTQIGDTYGATAPGGFYTPNLLDAAGNNLIQAIADTGTPVDYFSAKNSNTTNHTVTLTAVGTDANISINLVPKGTGSVLCNGASCGTGGGVSSVSGDGAVFTNSLSTGAVTLTLGSQAANTVFAGPTTGAATVPTFRALVGGDLPNPSATTLGGIESFSSVAHQFINSISIAGVPSAAQPAFSDLSGSATCAQLPALTGDTTTSAGTCATTTAKINGGSFPASANGIGSNASSQPVAWATLPTAAMPALTGDVTNTAGSLATSVKAIHYNLTSVTSAASPYTVAATDSYIACDATTASVTLNLPAATGTGREIVIERIDSAISTNACVVNRNGTDLIDGQTSFQINSQNFSVSIVDQASGVWKMRGSVAGASQPWITANGNSAGGALSGTANRMSLWGFVLNYPLTTTTIGYNVSVADNTANTYDLSIYSSNGTQLAHIGSTAGTTFAPSTGWKSLSWAASTYLLPGKYYIGLTSSCVATCVKLIATASTSTAFIADDTIITITTGGTAPATITPPADAYVSNASQIGVAVR